MLGVSKPQQFECPDLMAAQIALYISEAIFPSDSHGNYVSAITEASCVPPVYFVKEKHNE